MTAQSERFTTATGLVEKYVMGSMAIGLIPIPAIDVAGLFAQQLYMLKQVGKIYGQELSNDVGRKTIAALLGGLVPTALFLPTASLLRVVPVVGHFVSLFTMPMLAGAATYALGRVFIDHFESGGTALTLNPAKLRENFRTYYNDGRKRIAANGAVTAGSRMPHLTPQASRRADPSTDDRPSDLEQNIDTDSKPRQPAQPKVQIATSGSQAYDSAVLGDKPIAYFKLDETSGTTVADATGNGNIGAIKGGVKLGQPGAIAGSTAMEFDGATGYLEFGGSWGGGEAITVEAWIKVSETSDDFQAVVSAPGMEFVHLQLAGQGNIAAYTDAGAILLPIVPQTPTNIWRHVALVVNSGASRVYVDGKEVGGSDAAFSSINATPIVRIGSGCGGGRFFHGQIDRVAIYKTALSGEQIQSHVNAADKSGEQASAEQGIPTRLPAAVMAFDGKSNVSFEKKDEFKVQREITLEAWVNASAQAKWTGILSRVYDTGATESGYGLLLNGANGIIFGLTPASTKRIVYQAAADVLPLNQWRHVACTWDGQQMRIYIDGEEKAVRDVAADGIHYVPDNDLFIGQYKDNNETYPFKGKIGEVRLWQVSRTPEQIKANKDRRLTGNEDGLVGYWPLAEIDADGNTPDLSCNNNPGTVHGASITSDPALSLDPAAKPVGAKPVGVKPPVVYHGQHTHVDGYAKDSALTIILLAKPAPDLPVAVVCQTWDRNGAGVRNATGQSPATVSHEGETLIVRAGYYWFKGIQNDAGYSGKYYDPKNKRCGDFKLRVFDAWTEREESNDQLASQPSADGGLTSAQRSAITPVYGYHATGPWRYQYSTNPNIGAGWIKDGVAFYAFSSQVAGTVPIYEYHATEPWRYQYSTNPNIEAGWIKDGVAFYAFASQVEGSVPIHGYHATDPWRYQYSTNPNIEAGWIKDGVAFYLLDRVPADKAPAM